MTTPFIKMHGLGNDFAIFDERATPLPLTPARITALANRHTGIGCDQLIRLLPADDADATLHISNADGSPAAACGNATRCVAAWLHAQTGQTTLRLRTAAGLLTATIEPDGQVTVNMGAPRLHWREIPLAHEADTLSLPLTAGPLANPAACSMGNPHITFFVQDLAAINLAALGPGLEHHELFPERANIGVAQILAPDHIRLRVFERGAGLTRACGSGACAALVNAARRGLTARHATIDQDGGTLTITWTQANTILMTGPTTEVFSGSINLEQFPNDCTDAPALKQKNEKTSTFFL